MNLWVLFLSVFVWLFVLTYYLYQALSHYKRLVRGTQKDNLQEVLDKILVELSLNKTEAGKLRENLQEEREKSTFHIQKIGILKYNPFADTGGEQSFILAILDGSDSGLVLTSLHSRGNTRWYIKKVTNGKGTDLELTQEEKKTIESACAPKEEKKK